MGEQQPQQSVTRGKYGVKLVRGPFVRLTPHEHACSDEREFLSYVARLRADGERLAADLFSGAGGLSLGLEAAGYRVVLSADHDPEAVETHRHHFGGLALNWNLRDPERVAAVADMIAEAGVELLAGGPPCQPFSRAGRSKVRHRMRDGHRDPNADRRDLWQQYLEVIRRARPPAVLMENVPDMALDREMAILRAMVDSLEDMGYAVEERLVDTSVYGVPQFRQRLILVALRDRIQFQWPQETPDKITVWNAIGDLPEVEGGWRPKGGADGWSQYQGPVTDFQRRMRHGMDDEGQADRVYDHITRPVREDDLRAFELMDAQTRYSHLPAEVKRYRDDIFDDKYKRLDEDGLSRTITAHIAKDGYWYIHPRQNRTLTVREAARLQTFPDHFRFAGPPSAAFRQIGNAVPPALGERLADAIRSSLEAAGPSGALTSEVASSLAQWFRALPALAVPWLRANTRWQVISAETVLERLPAAQIRTLWPLFARWSNPADTLAARDEVIEIASWVGRPKRAERLLDLAEQVKADHEAIKDDARISNIAGLSESIADLAVLAVATSGPNSEEPVLTARGVLRVVARFSGEGVDRRNRMTDGRLGVARMIGDGFDARDAHLALIELAASACRLEKPSCVVCPLDGLCLESKARTDRQEVLF